MFGTDEFGNSRLLPLAFALIFALLAVGLLATSQTLWAPAAALTSSL
ncbi:MAG: hypothetical protein KDK10_10990 [Maritimibacter sp.]|nr:hypothetical protein [Maritimibacter sp.]